MRGGREATHEGVVGGRLSRGGEAAVQERLLEERLVDPRGQHDHALGRDPALDEVPAGAVAHHGEDVRVAQRPHEQALERPDGPRFKAFLGMDSYLSIPERMFGSAAPAIDPVSRVTAETPLPPVYFAVGSDDRAALGLAQTAMKLIELEQKTTVQETRSAFQHAVERRFITAVEELTHRRVRRFVPVHHVGPDLELDLFFFEG